MCRYPRAETRNMLRSTSIKLDSWKPVKLLARQPVDDKILSISCDLKGDVVAALTNSSISIFANRELLDNIPLKRGKQVYVSGNTNSILALTSKKLVCYDLWGQVKWEYSGVVDNSVLRPTPNFDFILISHENSLNKIGRFGEILNETNFNGEIIDFSIYEKKTVVSTEMGLFVLDNDGKVLNVKSDIKFSSVHSTSDHFIAVSENKMVAYSYGGLELWQKEGKFVNDLNFLREGTQHIFTLDFKTLVCQDRNGDEIWKYRSKEKLQGAYSLYSGRMTGVFSSSVFHVIDGSGHQAWSYQAREKVVDFSFPSHGGDVIVASENKLHWFQNEGFLRSSFDEELHTSEILISKVSVYEDNLDRVKYDIDKSKSLYSGKFTLVKESFDIITSVNRRLTDLHQRHVGYLDGLSNFMEQLGLQGAQTDDMVPQLYPYYSLHSDLGDISELNNLLERAKFMLSKLDKYKFKGSEEGTENSNSHFLKEAKKGVSEEITNVEGLIKSAKNDVKSLESNVKDLVIDWLKTGQLDDQPRQFLETYHQCEKLRYEKQELITNKIENHMAFVDYSDKTDHIFLDSLGFECKSSVNLNLNLKNVSDGSLSNVFLRIKIEGSGLNLVNPLSGVIRLNHLDTNETYSPIFTFDPVNRSFTRVALIIQYQDEAGRSYTSWLGDIETNFLGCYIEPYKISEDEHGELRLENKDSNSHISINVEGLTINKLTNMCKNLPGMHLSSFKEENLRSIIYHSAKSSLDESIHLSMIFLRTIGGEESLRSALELICHAPDITKSSELKDELISYLKNRILRSNGRLV